MEANPEQRSRRSGDAAFLVVVAAGYIVTLVTPLNRSGPLWLSVFLLLGAAYVALGLWVSRRLERPISPAFQAGLIALQLALGGVITYLGQGNTWLVLLPMVGQSIEHLKRPWSYLGCALVWVMQIAPIFLLAGWQAALSWSTPFLAAVVFVAIFTQMTVSEQTARRDLSAANQKLREYAAQIEELAVVRERNRLAREIHDGLGHFLTGIHIQIKAARATAGQDPALSAAALEKAQTLTQEALADVRRSVSALRSDPSSERPLAERLEALAAEGRGAGLDIRLSLSGEALPLSPQVDLALYRAAQEGLTNVRKHARAARAELNLEYLPQRVRLTLTDDGVGLPAVPAPAGQGGFGLLGLRERLALLGGELRIAGAPGGGVCVVVEIPVGKAP